LIEVGFALPLFVVLVVGVFELARLIFTQAALTNSVREMGRALAIPSTTGAAAIDAFNRTAVLPGTNTGTDALTIRVYSPAGTLLASQTGACMLPLSAATCTVPARTAASEAGWVDATVSYQFVFAVWLQGPQGAAFTLSPITIGASTRVFIE